MTNLIGIMEWTRPKPWKLDWELKKGGEIIATMSSPKMFGTSVHATIGGTTYALRKGGLRKPGAIMHKLGEEGEVALLQLDSIGRGAINVGSSHYLWEREGSTDQWTLSQEGRGTIFVTTRDTRSKYPTGKVDIDIADPHLDVLLLLTWFLASTSEC
jgi:hypothetical protein